jgi:tryptophan synthase alpha chain
MDIAAYIHSRLGSKLILFMPHMVVGYPSLKANWTMLEIMAAVGVDLVELQMPFSEPIADGLVLATAQQSAIIANGMTVQQYFDFTRRVTSTFDIPVLAVGYSNWPEQMERRRGSGSFARSLAQSGACGYIIADRLPESAEAEALRAQCEANDLTQILIMSPANTVEHLEQIGARGKGFLYCKARRGPTGGSTNFDDPEVDHFIQRSRAVTPLPLGVGFGITTASDIRWLHGKADVAIIGSELARKWDESESGYRKLLEELAKACVQ